MNRFEQTKIPFKRPFLISFFPITAFIIILVLFMGGIHSVSDTTFMKQQESLETALTRSIAHCYAVEGAYPPSLEY